MTHDWLPLYRYFRLIHRNKITSVYQSLTYSLVLCPLFTPYRVIWSISLSLPDRSSRQIKVLSVFSEIPLTSDSTVPVGAPMTSHPPGQSPLRPNRVDFLCFHLILHITVPNLTLDYTYLSKTPESRVPNFFFTLKIYLTHRCPPEICPVTGAT